MSIVFNNWGFQSNPFNQNPLPPDQNGRDLLIGRDNECHKLCTRLASPPKLVTIEGPNGIGKTSIINVASYIAMEKFIHNQSGELLIPCTNTFQLSTSTDTSNFKKRVFRSIAITLSDSLKILQQSGRAIPDHDELIQWINSPIFRSSSLSGGVAGFSAGGSSSTSANSSEGFTETGLENAVRNWLNDLFPNNEGGGVVCTIDNLELLESSKKARYQIEELRDELLNSPGIRWVLCGATGIVRGLTSTPRLSGYLFDPIEVHDISHDRADEILNARINVFSVNDDCYLPLTPYDFKRLYRILNGNIRDTLSKSEIYCTNIFEEAKHPDDDTDRHLEFERWLRHECNKVLEAASNITDRPWKLFNEISESGGQCSPSEHERFGFNSQQAMRSCVIKLEEQNLIQSVRDDDDSRRKTINITSNGWLANYARQEGHGNLFDEKDE